MKNRENVAGREFRARIAGIAVELAFVIGLSAIGCLVCAVAFLLAG